MNEALGVVRVGPAGWSYEDWKGVVYPASGGPHPLVALSRWFDTVEVNSTFYRPPDARYCAAWIKHVAHNENFRFTAKLLQAFTHTKGAWPAQDVVAQVFEGFRPLVDAGLLAALLVQLPWSFKRTPEGRQHLARVIETFHAFPLAIELRHDSWNHVDTLAGMRERGVALCNIDQPIFDHSIAPDEHVTAAFAYIRLHGRNYENWFNDKAGRDERYDYLYSEEELEPWLRRIESVRKRAADTYVITNNHFRGQAVVNALELQYGSGGREIELPEQLINQYPRLRRLMATGRRE